MIARKLDKALPEFVSEISNCNAIYCGVLEEGAKPVHLKNLQLSPLEITAIKENYQWPEFSEIPQYHITIQ
jgi:hypothetical protein